MTRSAGVDSRLSRGPAIALKAAGTRRTSRDWVSVPRLRAYRGMYRLVVAAGRRPADLSLSS
jgi:hypothetical protein